MCFLLFLLQNPGARNPVSVAVLIAAVFIIFSVCLFGELINIEVRVHCVNIFGYKLFLLSFQTEKIRCSLYALDWHEYDIDTRKLVYFLIVCSTPDTTIKVGSIFKLNMESFASVIRGLCERERHNDLRFSFSLLKCASPCAPFSKLFKCDLKILSINYG